MERLKIIFAFAIMWLVNVQTSFAQDSSTSTEIPLKKLESYIEIASKISTYSQFSLPRDQQNFAAYQANQSAELILNWILLMDALKDNPFYSPKLLDFYRQHRSCVHLIYLQSIEARIQANEDRGPEFMQAYLANLERNLQTDPQLFKGEFYEGTETYKLSEARGFMISRPTPALEEEFKWVRYASRRMNYRPKPSTESIAEARGCQALRQDLFNEIFPWLDFAAFEEVNKGYQGTADQFTNLQALIKSTAVPNVPTHSGAAPALHPKLALTPVSGLTEIFARDLLSIGPQILKSRKDFFSKETCKALTPIAIVSSILGIEVSSKNAELWKSWMVIRLSSMAASTAGLEDCTTLLSFVENISPSATGFPGLYSLVQFSTNYTSEKFEISSLGNPLVIKGSVRRKLESRKINDQEEFGIPAAKLR